MNHKIKRLWCAALRGGSWEQCLLVMLYPDNNKRCALGVLLEVLRGDPDAYHSVRYNLPHPDLPSPATRTAIASLNDRAGYSFEQIANFIEEKVP